MKQNKNSNFHNMSNNYNTELTPSLISSLKKIRHVALDMDGTIYLGNRLFPYTLGFLKTLTENGIGYSFLTNNPTKSIEDYLAKLAGMGIHATEENMYTTSIAAIDYIKDRKLMKAVEFLRDGMAVQDIAKRLGYRSSQYFIRIFKENYGTTPYQYKKTVLDTEES